MTRGTEVNDLKQRLVELVRRKGIEIEGHKQLFSKASQEKFRFIGNQHLERCANLHHIPGTERRKISEQIDADKIDVVEIDQRADPSARALSHRSTRTRESRSLSPARPAETSETPSGLADPTNETYQLRQRVRDLERQLQDANAKLQDANTKLQDEESKRKELQHEKELIQPLAMIGLRQAERFLNRGDQKLSLCE